jgi:hypothetical protein
MDGACDDFNIKVGCKPRVVINAVSFLEKEERLRWRSSDLAPF